MFETLGRFLPQTLPPRKLPSVESGRGHAVIKTTMDSKRISSRYVFEARFRISVQRHGKSLVFEGRARDISESGLGAFVGQALSAGELVTLAIPVPGLEKASLQAKVARVLGTEYGFQFLTLSPVQRSHIQVLVQNRIQVPVEKRS